MAASRATCSGAGSAPHVRQVARNPVHTRAATTSLTRPLRRPAMIAAFDAILADAGITAVRSGRSRKPSPIQTNCPASTSADVTRLDGILREPEHAA